MAITTERDAADKLKDALRVASEHLRSREGAHLGLSSLAEVIESLMTHGRSQQNTDDVLKALAYAFELSVVLAGALDIPLEDILAAHDEAAGYLLGRPAQESTRDDVVDTDQLLRIWQRQGDESRKRSDLLENQLATFRNRVDTRLNDMQSALRSLQLVVARMAGAGEIRTVRELPVRVYAPEPERGLLIGAVEQLVHAVGFENG